MSTIRAFFQNFIILDYIIWVGSVAAIILSFFLCGSSDYIQLAAALIGACSLILIAKGNVLGEFLGLIFAVFYGIVSFFYHYYGEMITYLCMSAPMAVAAIIAWFRHPFAGKKNEVEVNTLPAREYVIISIVSVVVTVAFYFILGALDTANLIWSSVSVLTSCFAALLSMRRSPFYALAYAFNDIVLIVLWVLAMRENIEYVTMVVCFTVFLLNDLYGLFNWLKMRKRQAATKISAQKEPI